MTDDTLRAAGMTVLERGWLSSNNVLLHGADREEGAVLVDAGHVNHAAQTLALLQTALGGERLARLVNTHLHADHCGGNASVQAAYGCRISVPVACWAAVQAWDEVALSYAPTGQRCQRFVADDTLSPGQNLRVGGQRWDVHAAPGHDPSSLILFNAQHGIVITADALWERGFGVVFPELDGVQAFDEVAATLDLIASFDARWALPGHGAPFTDVPAALQRARERLAAFRAQPQRHAQHALKALLSFHLLEVQSQSWADLLDWFGSVSLYRAVWTRLGRPCGDLAAYGRELVAGLAAQGVLVIEGDQIRKV